MPYEIINCRHVGVKRLTDLIENAEKKETGSVRALARALGIPKKTTRERAVKLAKLSLANVRDWDADIREKSGI